MTNDSFSQYFSLSLYLPVAYFHFQVNKCELYYSVNAIGRVDDCYSIRVLFKKFVWPQIMLHKRPNYRHHLRYRQRLPQKAMAHIRLDRTLIFATDMVTYTIKRPVKATTISAKWCSARWRCHSKALR